PIPYPDIFHKSFVYRDGIITIPSSGFDQAVPVDINASGQLLGRPFCPCFGSMRPGPSFYVYDNTTGSQLFTPPNSIFGGSPVSISDNGQVLGTYFGINETHHAYVYNKGVYTTLNFPSTVSGSVWVNDINNDGQVVGYYGNNFHYNGSLYNGGVFTSFDIPGATDTSIVSNNAKSQLAGTYIDGVGVKHGYIATPITAKPTTEKQCKKNGWKNFGFKNRKACIKYVESLEEDDEDDDDD
ncbi:MAG: hypothetical protein HOO87_14720, partial [Methyloglobulus sp.]|nr:hypothetical protein [Methyloglobulus sp.]